MERIFKFTALFILYLAVEIFAIVVTGGWHNFVTQVNGWSGFGSLLAALAIVAIVLGLWVFHGAMDYAGKTGLFVAVTAIGTLLMVVLAVIGLWRIGEPISKVYTTTLWLPAIAFVATLVTYYGRLSRPTITTT